MQCGLWGPAGAMPLVSVNVSARVHLFCAEVAASFIYRVDHLAGDRSDNGHCAANSAANNAYSAAKEGVAVPVSFKFPLDVFGALCHFSVRIGQGERVVATVHARSSTASLGVTSSQSEYLVDESSPHLFMCHLGAVPVGDTVEINLTYVTEIEADPTQLRLVLPASTVSPSYHRRFADRNCAQVASGNGSIGGVIGNDCTEQDSRTFDLAVRVNLRCPGEILRVFSPTHGSDVDTSPDLRDHTKAVVSVLKPKTDRQGSFVLIVGYKRGADHVSIIHRRRNLVEGENAEQQYALMLSFCPKWAVPSEPDFESEFVFLVDCSNDMAGSRLSAVLASLKHFLRSLPRNGSRFNIIEFGSTFKMLFADGSQEVTNPAILAAYKYVSQIKADFGGTELLAPLKAVFSRQCSMLRQLIIVTAGQISNTDDVLGYISHEFARSAASSCTLRVLPVGIGDYNSALIDGLARAGRGVAEYVLSASDDNESSEILLQTGLSNGTAPTSPSKQRNKHIASSVSASTDGLSTQPPPAFGGLAIRSPLLPSVSCGFSGSPTFLSPAPPALIDATNETEAEEIQSRVARQQARAFQPPVTDIVIDWGAIGASDFQQVPAHVRAFFSGDRINVFAFAQDVPETVVRLRGKRPGGTLLYNLRIDPTKIVDVVVGSSASNVNLGNDVMSETAVLHALCVAHHIRELELFESALGDDALRQRVVDLGTEYGIASRFTDFAVMHKSGDARSAGLDAAVQQQRDMNELAIDRRLLMQSTAGIGLRNRPNFHSDDTKAEQVHSGAGSRRRVYSQNFLLSMKEMFADKHPQLHNDVDVVLSSATSDRRGLPIRCGRGGFVPTRGIASCSRGAAFTGFGRGVPAGSILSAHDAFTLQPLSTSKDGWVPQHLLEKNNPVDGLTASSAESNAFVGMTTQHLLARTQGILNKLTVEYFDKLSSKLIHLVNCRGDAMQGCIRQIFDKALLEEHFSKMYAKLCERMCAECTLVTVVGEDGNPRELDFQREVVEHCQNQFRNRSITIDLKHSVLDADEQRMLHLRKMLGNMKFIGELYQSGLIRRKVVHACIQALLVEHSNSDRNTDLECLCKLLSVVGKTLDAPSYAAKDNNFTQDPGVDQYFERLGELASSDATPPRIRFALRDLTELRQRNWVPRRKELEATTLSQARDDAVLARTQITASGQSIITSLQTESVRSRSSIRGALPARRGSTRNPATSLLSGADAGGSSGSYTASSSADGWQDTGRANRGLTRFSHGSRGRGRGAEPSSNLRPQPHKTATTSGFGGFAALGDADEDSFADEDGFQSGPRRARPSRRTANMVKPIVEVSAGSFASLCCKGETGSNDSGTNVNDGGNDCAPHKESTVQTRSVKPVKKSVRLVLPCEKRSDPNPVLNLQLLKSQTEMLLDEFLASYEVADALDCVRDLKTPKYHPEVVRMLVGHAMEQGPAQRRELQKLFFALLADLVSVSDARIGFDRIAADIIDGLELDIPFAFRYVAEFMGTAAASGTDGSSSWTRWAITEAFTPFVATGKASQMLAHFLVAFSSQATPAIAAAALASIGEPIADVISKCQNNADLDACLDLKVTLEAVSAPVLMNSSLHQHQKPRIKKEESKLYPGPILYFSIFYLH